MSRSLLARVMSDTAHLQGLSAGQWDMLIRQARHSSLLARLGERVAACGAECQVPPAAHAHLRAAGVMVRAQHAAVRFEVAALLDILGPLDIPIVLLKGAAYVMADPAAAVGRTLTDIDILVPRTALSEVESRLLLSGWHGTHTDAYDQRYYRQWMHELPPMMHGRRGTMLDVHHAILPLTARLKPSPQHLLDAAEPVAGHGRLQVLSPADRVLHSMTHLLFNEDLSHGLRDLSDIDLLLRHHGHTAGYWSELLTRAALLNLSAPLLHGLLLSTFLLHTPVPQAVFTQARSQAGLNRVLEQVLQLLWRLALDCPHPSARSGATGMAASAAAAVLYLRAHGQRMPPALLMRHLAVKLARRLRPRSDARPSPSAPEAAH